MAETNILIDSVECVGWGSDWLQWSELKNRIQDWAVLSYF